MFVVVIVVSLVCFFLFLLCSSVSVAFVVPVLVFCLHHSFLGALTGHRFVKKPYNFLTHVSPTDPFFFGTLLRGPLSTTLFSAPT